MNSSVSIEENKTVAPEVGHRIGIAQLKYSWRKRCQPDLFSVLVNAWWQLAALCYGFCIVIPLGNGWKNVTDMVGLKIIQLVSK